MGDQVCEYDELIKKQDESGFKHSYRLVGPEGARESNIYTRELNIYHHAGKQGVVGMADLTRIERWDAEDTEKYVHNTTDEKRCCHENRKRVTPNHRSGGRGRNHAALLRLRRSRLKTVAGGRKIKPAFPRMRLPAVMPGSGLVVWMKFSRCAGMCSPIGP